ncbi:MAG: amidohydrolase family protein [Acidimicrobiales bacterium]
MATAPGPFEAAYLAGVPDEVPARAERRPGLAAPDGYALGGCVLTPDVALDPGFVVVGPDGLVADVTARRPDAVAVWDTAGVILPGLVDLHGHPEFNVFSPWEPPRLYANRTEWRASPEYAALVRQPQDHLLTVLAPDTETRYAEVRALVAGTTAIQGASGRGVGPEESLVRNVDLFVFGAHRARSLVDVPADDDAAGMARLRTILGGVAAGTVDRLYLHVAEGHPDDPQAAAEFDRMVALGALSAATVVIHGTALSRDQLGAVRDAGASLVWSPQSNLRLYGATTRVADALDLGLPLGLGADWLPTGSPSLLGELKVAGRVLAAQGRPLEPPALVAMVTAGAAAIAGLDAHLGTLAPGRPADLVVLERHHDDPWRSVVEAEAAWVDLVAIGGDLTYGRRPLLEALAPGAGGRAEAVVAWGKEMLLDTSWSAGPPPAPPATLAELRAALVAAYPPVGPIFA